MGRRQTQCIHARAHCCNRANPLASIKYITYTVERFVFLFFQIEWKCKSASNIIGLIDVVHEYNIDRYLKFPGCS